MASEYTAHSRSQGNDTSAETYGEPQTPAELPKSSTAFAAVKSQTRRSAAFLRFVSFHAPSLRRARPLRIELQSRSKRNTVPGQGGFAQQVLRGKRRRSKHEPTQVQTPPSLLWEAARCQPPLEVPLFLDPPSQ